MKNIYIKLGKTIRGNDRYIQKETQELIFGPLGMMFYATGLFYYTNNNNKSHLLEYSIMI